MFRFIKNSLIWVSIPLVLIFIIATVKELFAGMDELLFQSLVLLAAWLVFAILAIVVGISNYLFFESAKKKNRDTRIIALKTGGAVSFALFAILGLMTTPLLPLLPIEPNWYFLSTLIVCWVFGIFGYNSLVKNLTQ